MGGFFIALLGKLAYHCCQALKRCRSAGPLSEPPTWRITLMGKLFSQVIILHLWYAKWFDAPAFIHGHAFNFTCLWLFIDNTVLWAVSDFRHCLQVAKFVRHPSAEIASRTRFILDESDEAVVINIYLAVTKDLSRVILVFIIQISLIGCYAYYLDTDSGTHKMENLKLGFWFLGTLLSSVCGQGQTGESFDTERWAKLKAILMQQWPGSQHMVAFAHVHGLVC